MNTNMLLLAYHPFKFMEKREKEGPSTQDFVHSNLEENKY